jgi:NAD(P) transhydrogenase
MPHLFPYGIYSVPRDLDGRQDRGRADEGRDPLRGRDRALQEIARGAILGDDSGLLKLLFHRDDRKILGVHIIGTSATELVHIGQAVMAFGGTLDYLVYAVFNYPTFAECYKVAALDGYNKIGPASDEVPPPGSGLARYGEDVPEAAPVPAAGSKPSGAPEQGGERAPSSPAPPPPTSRIPKLIAA